MYLTDAGQFLDDKCAFAPLRGPAKAGADGGTRWLCGCPLTPRIGAGAAAIVGSRYNAAADRVAATIPDSCRDSGPLSEPDACNHLAMPCAMSAIAVERRLIV